MSTVITSVFRDHRTALEAMARLEAAGFRRADMRVVDATTPDRHAFVQRRVADTRRATMLGLAVGPLLGAIAGSLLAAVYGTAVAMLVGILVGAIGGVILGSFVGRTTTTQMSDELEHQIERGSVILRMFVDPANTETALRIVDEHSGAHIKTTPTTLTGGTIERASPDAKSSSSRWTRAFDPRARSDRRDNG